MFTRLTSPSASGSPAAFFRPAFWWELARRLALSWACPCTHRWARVRPGFGWEAARLVALSVPCFFLVLLATADNVHRDLTGEGAPWHAVADLALGAALGVVAFALVVWASHLRAGSGVRPDGPEDRGADVALPSPSGDLMHDRTSSDRARSWTFWRTSAWAARPGHGFTLLELIVVIVILGILAALAVPTFDKVMHRAKVKTLEASAQATVREAVLLAGFDGAAVSAAGDVRQHLADAAADVASRSVRAVNGQVTTDSGHKQVTVYASPAGIVQAYKVEWDLCVQAQVSSEGQVTWADRCETYPGTLTLMAVVRQGQSVPDVFVMPYVPGAFNYAYTDGGVGKQTPSPVIYYSTPPADHVAVTAETRDRINYAVSTVAGPEPTAPTPTVTTTSTSVDFTWQPEGFTPASDWQFHRCAGTCTPTTTGTPHGTAPLAASSWSDTQVAASSTYSYVLRVQSTSGDWLTSNVVTVTTLSTLTAAPVVKVDTLTSTDVSLSWTAVTGATSYLSEFTGDAGVTWSKMYDTDTTDTFVSANMLSAGHTYSVRVAGVNSSGTGAYGTVTFTAP